MENKKLDIAKEIARSMVVDAFRHGQPTGLRTVRHCGTNFNFINQNKVTVNDKKRNLRFTLTIDKTVSTTDNLYGWDLEFHRNDGRKVKKLLNSARWKTAVDRISASMTPAPIVDDTTGTTA